MSKHILPAFISMCCIMIFCVIVIGWPRYSMANDNDYIPTTCSDMPDDFMHMVCETARKFDAPLYQTFAVFMMADIEATGKACNFKFTEVFYSNRNKVRNSKKMMQVYDYIIANSADDVPNKKAYCQQKYSLFGQGAPRGVGGGDTRMYR